MRERVMAFHSRMGHRNAMCMVANFETLAKAFHERQLDIGTACSGSDMPVKVWEHLMSYVQAFYDVTIKWRHRFQLQKQCRRPGLDPLRMQPTVPLRRHHEPRRDLVP